MSIKRALAHIPFAVQAYNELKILAKSRSNNNILNQLENTPYRQGGQIWQALKSFQHTLSQADQTWKERIEIERKRLLARNEPLNDGSLGKGGLYDDEKSVKQACQVSKRPQPALLLFLLIRAIQPLHVIELGTNVGISSAYIAAALKANGQNGRMTTLDASPYRQHLAREIHRNLGIDNISYVRGLFTDTLTPTLADIGSIDFAFIDGHHQYQPTLDYYEMILPHSTPGAVFVFDDIRWSDGMKKAWSQIQSDDRLGLIVDLSSVGICARRQPELSQRFVLDPVYAF